MAFEALTPVLPAGEAGMSSNLVFLPDGVASSLRSVRLPPVEDLEGELGGSRGHF